MRERTHRYELALVWTGNDGDGTAHYRSYRRDHEIAATGKAAGRAPIAGSSDVAFRGDAARWNPEELLVASLSACHMLWYLHLAADAGIVVINYEDAPVGTMVETQDDAGRFAEVVLHPTVTIRADDTVLGGGLGGGLGAGLDNGPGDGSNPLGDTVARAMALHEAAHAKCFIANSVNFPVLCEAQIRAG